MEVIAPGATTTAGSVASHVAAWIANSVTSSNPMAHKGQLNEDGTVNEAIASAADMLPAIRVDVHVLKLKCLSECVTLSVRVGVIVLK